MKQAIVERLHPDPVAAQLGLLCHRLCFWYPDLGLSPLMSCQKCPSQSTGQPTTQTELPLRCGAGGLQWNTNSRTAKSPIQGQ